jgi:hypothetical protein
MKIPDPELNLSLFKNTGIALFLFILLIIGIRSCSTKIPVITITKMDFSNSLGKKTLSSGTSFYDNDIRYIGPRITYENTGNITDKIDLGIKIFDPNGKLKRGSSSPAEYCYISTLDVQAGKNGENISISGWGNEKGGTYSPGTYTCEIWHKGKKLYNASFTVITAPPLTVPGNVRASTVGTDRVTIHWNSSESGISYKVYYGTQSNVANARSISSTANSVTITGLTSNISYYFWVTAIKGEKETDKSSALIVKTATKSSPAPVNPLNGTTWEYTNQNDNGNRYRLAFSGNNKVTFAIHNSNDSRQLESYNGTYWLQGNSLTIEIIYSNNDKITDYYTYSQSGITNNHKQSIIYKKH